MTPDLDFCLAFVDAHPDDAARVLEGLPPGDVATFVGAVPARVAASVLERTTPAAAADCLARMPTAEAAALVAEFRVDLAAALLRRMDDAMQAAVLGVLPAGEAGLLRRALRYPEGTAGALMDPRVVAFADDVTAGEALRRVRRSPSHMLYYLYVSDRGGRLVGVLDIRELLLARPGQALAEVMHRSVARLSAHMGRTAILAHPGWKEFHALPVVDEDSMLLGVVRYQMLRRLEDDGGGQQRGADAVAAAFALGELYWLGLSGLLEGLASALKQVPARDARMVEANHGTA